MAEIGSADWWMEQGCVSTSDLALHFTLPVGTIRRWACVDGWRPHGTRRHRYWSIADAQASYDRHRMQHADADAACA